MNLLQIRITKHLYGELTIIKVFNLRFFSDCLCSAQSVFSCFSKIDVFNMAYLLDVC